MSPKGRPEGEYRSAQREGGPVRPKGRPEGEYRSAERGRIPASARRQRWTRTEWVAFCAAVVLAHLFYARIVRYPSDFDAANYLDIAVDMARKGLFSEFYYANIRTYGYPLVLTWTKALADVLHLPWGLVIFEAQLVTYLAACVALRNAVARHDPAFARWVMIGLAANLVALSYTPESLTESIALTLVMLAAAVWIRMRDPATSLVLPVLLGTLLISFAVMVRPASLFALAAWFVAVALVAWERQVGWKRSLVLVLVLAAATAVPMLPQLANNMRYYGEATPLVVARLGTNQQVWGIQYIKYATALEPVPLPSVFYENPFARERPIDPVHPLRWYWTYPAAGAATLALHVFNMLDQDLLFTYSRDLDPWYRIPLGLLTHAFVALALVAGVLLVVRRRTLAITGAAIGTFVAAHVGLHATTAVEMRFGLPLLVLVVPMAIWSFLQLRSSVARPVRLAVFAFVVAYAAGALWLSDWVREQAPSIRTWQASERQAGGR